MAFGTTPITPGAGVDVAVDDVAGDLFQRVKLDVGAAGASVPLVGTAARGIPVDPRPKWARVAVAPNFSTAAYVAGDVMGGEITIPGAVREAGALSRLRHMTMWYKGLTPAFDVDLYFVDRPLVANAGAGKADQAAFAPDSGDLPFFTGRWHMDASGFYDLAANSVRFGDDQDYAWNGFPIDVVLRSESNTDAYLYVISTNGVDLTTATDIGFVFFVEQF